MAEYRKCSPKKSSQSAQKGLEFPEWKPMPENRALLVLASVREGTQISERNDFNPDLRCSEYAVKGSPQYAMPCLPAQTGRRGSQDRERPKTAEETHVSHPY